MCGPPPRDIFCDARNVAVEAASLKLYLVLLVSDHCSRKGITLSGIEALTKRRLVSGATGAGSSSSSDQAEVDATRTIREESVTPSRRAPYEVQRFSSGRQPWTQIIAAVQGARAHPARNRQSSGRISSVVRRVGISGTPLGTDGRACSCGEGRLAARRRRQWRQPTTNCPPFRKLATGVCRPPVREVPDLVARITSQTPSEAVRVRQNDLEMAAVLVVSPGAMLRLPSDRIATGKVALVGHHRIVALCCRTPQRSRTKARYGDTTEENTPCGSDADPLSWPANALLHHQVGACGASADPPCALASHGAASRATAVDGMDLSELQAQLQSSKRGARCAGLTETALTTRSWNRCKLCPSLC